ncbi:hypothetical protein CMV_011954 [Castanea mollissima]|uniref:Mitochondrial substrate carrier family protein n=1 Tax=Castanea mollissima TaxID=60419 RepID=A0A8J4RFQ8_9ROSI|nr:hypothetical protein CMV_011954 [Castanea mollissima]
MLEGRKADVNGFLENLRFARVGGVPSGVVGVTSSVDEEGDDGVTTGNREETGGTLPQKLASGILSIPLSNVECLRSTLSTVSLTELIEPVPQLGRTSTDYPDKKKLFSVQDFFRYTEAEDTEGPISYGHFRNFMLLLPSDRLQDDPQSTWFEAATVVAIAPPVQIPAGSVLRSALAGGLSCALSCSLMHPVETVKTRVQASALTFPEIISKLPQIGIQGLYRGSIPAILGKYSSHGLRTGIFEASKLVLINVAPTLQDIQVQSLSSFCSTVLGTAVRIPCEVLKQRLQAGLFDNVGEAIVGTWQQDGLKGFFRGTGATLCGEVPFYVAGMGLYAESKKVAQQLLGRDLEPWETIAVGALSGGLAAVTTTPFDVMKTRMMTAQGRSVSMSMVFLSILRHEGPLGLFKGTVPRFFWIAPLGAMNFAGYELARKAMDKHEEQLVIDQLSQKKVASTG